jgi:hypothetical protein
MAIRRPNKPPETGADVFAIDTRGGTSPTPPTFYSGFPVDFSIRRDTTADDWHFRTRMTGEAGLLFPNQTLGETSNSSSTVTFDRMDGTGFNTGADSANYSWMFKRAPGFFDVVAYNSVSGGGVSNSQNHNLGVAPEMIIVKKRDALSGWPVYHTATGLTTSTKLHSPYIDTGAGSYWESAPTSTQFFPYGSDTNNTGSWIAYLFASLDGISSVGTYNGTTGDQEIDCGFIAGARFVLIKRTNSTSDWFLWDTTRGINDGANPNDPYIKLNHDEAQVTNTNLIDPLPEGFIAKNTDADINAVGGTYLYLAIA